VHIPAKNNSEENAGQRRRQFLKGLVVHTNNSLALRGWLNRK
jgi:hypothetical protein